MIPYKPNVLTSVPPTLEKLREVMQAMRTLAAQDDKLLRQRQANIAALRRDFEQLRRSLPGLLQQAIADVRRDCDPRLRSYVIKYSSDQPRLPAGNPDGGQWTSEGTSGASAVSASSAEPNVPSRPIQYAALDTGTRDDATSGASDVQVAAGSGRPGYPIDLQEEEARGGHTLGAHVGRSESSLLSEIRQIALSAGEGAELADGLREGSFPSVEAANKLVNSTVAQNQDKVALVTAGLSPREQLDAQFDSPTGYEAYLRTGNSTPYIRPTYGVRVIIVPDPGSAKGYRVDTAFPRNSDR